MYESLDYEQALEKLGRAKTYVQNLEDDALLSFYEGIILADMNRREQARTVFRSGLLLKPDATLPIKVSPKVEKDFEAVRADVQRELARTKQERAPLAEAARPPPAPEKLVTPALSSPGPGPAQPVEARRPSLEPAASTPGLTTTSPLRSKGLSYALMGGGAAVAGAGVFLGLSGLSYNERKKELTIDEAVKARATASTQVTASTVLLGAGLAALGTGTVLLLLPHNETGTAPAGSSASLVLTPLPGGFALGSTGRF